MAEVEPQPEPAPEPRWPTGPELLAHLTRDRRRLAAALATVLLVTGAGVAGYVLLRTPPAPPVELRLPYAPGAGGGDAASAPPSVTATTVPSEIVAHAAGAVLVPGIHRLPAGSRVADLLVAAGGPTADADLDRVNLAAVVTDGERVWFPRIGEPAPPDSAPIGGGSTANATPAAPVDLNTASAEELDALPGVGPSIAAAIVEHRQRHGPFRSVDQLLDVPGIGDAKLAQLRPLVSV